MAVFDRPIGAQADIKELEYISALHQSGSHVRTDGSIRDKDIKVYLRSRFGIEVSLEEVRKTILQGFGGSDDEGEVIDLMELTAMIIIPLLLKAAAVAKGRFLPPNVLPPPENVLEMGVNIILHDVTGSQDKSQLLTPEFLKQMLTIYGETGMAQDDELIQEMIQLASGGSRNVPKEFNVVTFGEGLTKDVELYNIANEVRKSTSVQDVFDDHDNDASPTTGITVGHGRAAGSIGENVELGLDVQKQPVREMETLKHIYTAPAIDIQAGTYRSEVLTLSLWGAVLFYLFSTVLQFLDFAITDRCPDFDGGWIDSADAIACQLVYSIFGFLVIFSVFSVLGVFSMGMGSLGNERNAIRWYRPLCGAIYVLCLTFSGLFYGKGTTFYLKYMTFVSIMLSIVTAYCHLGHVFTIVTNMDFENSMWGRRLGLSTFGREVQLKAAAAHKLNTLVGNATNLMASESPSSLSKTYFGHGLSVYANNGLSKETTGGLVWLWRSALDQSIFEKEGIWYSTRLVASNFAQFHVCIFIGLLGTTAIQYVKKNFGNAQSEAKSRFFQRIQSSQVVNPEDFDTATQEQLEAYFDQAYGTLYPQEEYMVLIPLYIGVGIAIIAALRLAILYLPGVTSTILELRTGVIPSLHSPTFQKYRRAPETVTLLTGTLFWGCLVSSVLFGALIASIIFLYLWQGSRTFMMKVTTSLLGALCVLLLRLCFVILCCRKRFYKGLYRTKPAAANISLLALEWSNFFFTAAFILVRMCKVLLVAAASIGQIDRRLLAEGVGQLGRLELDPYPTIHVRELVAHEAHRHPFIEILGTMYLMKLRYAKHFGSRAGSAWRLVFIYALLPWMNQYRILEKVPDTESEGDPTHEESHEESEERGTAKRAPRQHHLPSFATGSSIDERLWEIRNQRSMLFSGIVKNF